MNEITIEQGSSGSYWVFKGPKPIYIGKDLSLALSRANEFLKDKSKYVKGKTWEVPNER